MFEIEVGPAPVDLGAALGVPDTGNSGSVWRIQNRGLSAVYRTRAVTAPDPAAVRGFHHGGGSTVDAAIYTPDVVGRGRTWVWTAGGAATTLSD